MGPEPLGAGLPLALGTAWEPSSANGFGLCRSPRPTWHILLSWAHNSNDNSKGLLSYRGDLSFLGLDGGHIFKTKKLRGQRINSGAFEGRGSALALKC